MKKFQNKAFTVVETIIAVAVGLVLTLTVVDTFSRFRDSQALNMAVEGTISLINEARSKTLASKEFSPYGIHFGADRAVLFKGTVFLSSDPANKELKIPTLVDISSITLNGGGNELVFQLLTGKTSQFGTITFRLKRDSNKVKNIIVESSGIIRTQ